MLFQCGKNCEKSWTKNVCNILVLAVFACFLKTFSPLNKYGILRFLLSYRHNITIDSVYIFRLNHSSLNNEFFAKASQEWKERLLRGDFTPEALQKTKLDAERDRSKLDPWKARHFEPIWGIRKDYVLCDSVNVLDVKPAIKRRLRRKSKITSAVPGASGDAASVDEVDSRKPISDEDEPLLKRVKHKSPTAATAASVQLDVMAGISEPEPASQPEEQGMNLV